MVSQKEMVLQDYQYVSKSEGEWRPFRQINLWFPNRKRYMEQTEVKCIGMKARTKDPLVNATNSIESTLQ